MMNLHPYCHWGRPQVLRLLALVAFTASVSPATFGQDLHSVSIDRPNDRIVVRGANLDGVVSFTLGGREVATDNVTPGALDIPFSADVATAVQWRGSYRLETDSGSWITMYAAEPISVPSGPPPPPPPPPPGGTDCPCIAGWEASGIPKDNLTLCFWNYDTQQQWISGQRGSWFISTAYDPYNLVFDPVDPGNSISYCALHDGLDWTVAEPVVNQDQFDDCNLWLWRNICI